MKLARITSKGQVTIPKVIRIQLNAEKGDYLVFEPASNQSVTLRVQKQRPLSSLHGALEATRPFPGKEAVRDEVGRKLARGGIEND